MNDRENSNTPVGEVIKSSTSELVVQCHELYGAPPLGSLLKSGGDNPVFGIVGQIITQSIYPGRHPRAMAHDESTVEAVYDSNPQLSRLLSTDVYLIVVGYEQEGQINRYLAPLPPKIHDLVYKCEVEELNRFTETLDFLSLLLSYPVGSRDDVVSAFVRQASLSYGNPNEFLVHAGKELAFLLGNEMHRLNGILRRIRP